MKDRKAFGNTISIFWGKLLEVPAKNIPSNLSKFFFFFSFYPVRQLFYCTAIVQNMNIESVNFTTSSGTRCRHRIDSSIQLWAGRGLGVDFGRLIKSVEGMLFISSQEGKCDNFYFEGNWKFDNGWPGYCYPNRPVSGRERFGRSKLQRSMGDKELKPVSQNSLFQHY